LLKKRIENVLITRNTSFGVGEFLALRASPLGNRAFGSCWAKGPAVFGIRSLGGDRPIAPLGLMGPLGLGR
jgi:hypothetical protein